MVSTHNKKLNILVLAYPLGIRSVYTVSNKLVKIISALSEETFLISGLIPDGINWPKDVEIRDIGQELYDLRGKSNIWFSIWGWILKNILIQLLMTIELIKLSRRFSVMICFMGNQYQIPIIVSKILGKKVISASVGVAGNFAKVNFGSGLGFLAGLIDHVNFLFSDIIIIESDHLAQDNILQPWKKKLRNGALFLDEIDIFKNETPIKERQNIIGYLGRISSEKGILEFVNSIGVILEQSPDLEIIIIGSGNLDEKVDNVIEQVNSDNVKRYYWVEHQDIPKFLNKFKLLILPSQSEGLPNVILEAFGCGTPVLANPVGGVPEIVIEGKTGFHLPSVTPKDISDKISDILKNESLLEDIVTNSSELLRNKYSLDAAKARYASILLEFERMKI